jgi:hypothetical protein
MGPEMVRWLGAFCTPVSTLKINTMSDADGAGEKKKLFRDMDWFLILRVLVWIITLKLFGFWIANIILVLIFVLPLFFRKRKWKSDTPKNINFGIILKENWFKVTVVIFLVFGSYWFGLRPAQIKKECSTVKMHTDAVLAQAGTPNYPGCEKNPYYNPFFQIVNKNATGTPDRYASGSIIYGCNEAIAARPASDWERPARDAEYTQCLRNNGM